MAESADLLAQLPVAHACAVLDLARASYYRARRPSEPATEPAASACQHGDRPLWSAIEAVCLDFPGYGVPRVTRYLQREGWTVNHKRVARIMGAAGLTHARKRRQVRTTDSEHGFPVYPNLLADRGWRRLTGPNQAWGADLTYVRLREGFCYLAVVLDLFSRKVVGWDLSGSLEATGALAALEQALAARQPAVGWIHHSDRGVQYACRAYVEQLKAAGARISMCAVGAPKENAPTERLMRTLKEEEVDLQDYGELEEARQGIGQFIEAVYNQRRLHSALGYRPPSEYEEWFAAEFFH
jgi:transposase InsO family protein